MRPVLDPTMVAMSGERFVNARVHEWLTPALDATTEAMHTTRVQLNSAALWWFCLHMTPEQRAEILGEYVKVQALGGRDPQLANLAGSSAAPPNRGRKSR
jgi:hypothetical protein